MRNKTSVLAKLGVAAAMMVGLTVASQTAAAAAAPTFSVSPASGLHDGDTVTVTVTGAGANEVYGIAQCANIGASFGCDGSTATTFTTNASGAATFTLPVHKTYQAVTHDGVSLGTVDCGTTSCYIGAGNQNLALGDVVLSFR